MRGSVAQLATFVKKSCEFRVAHSHNDKKVHVRYKGGMAKEPRIHVLKQPRRPHFIKEWADKRNLSQADLARELGADKSIVSRWFSGSTPSVDWQERLAALFACEPDAIFRHPNDDWIRRFFEGRSEEEIEHIRKSLEITFPKRDGTNG